MAKTYSIKNTSFEPARPIGLMTTSNGVADGTGCTIVPPNKVPVILTAGEYAKCEEAIKRYVAADMMLVTVLGSDDEAGVELDTLKSEAKSLGIKGWHVMGKDKLIAAIEEAKQDA